MNKHTKHFRIHGGYCECHTRKAEIIVSNIGCDNTIRSFNRVPFIAIVTSCDDISIDFNISANLTLLGDMVFIAHFL